MGTVRSTRKAKGNTGRESESRKAPLPTYSGSMVWSDLLTRKAGGDRKVSYIKINDPMWFPSIREVSGTSEKGVRHSSNLIVLRKQGIIGNRLLCFKSVKKGGES